MKILLAGDSTVTEQPRSIPHDPAVCYAGWGQMLHAFVNKEVAILNFAVSGYTVEMLREQGKYNALCAAMEQGDYVLLQFGHNDQKQPHLRPKEGYAQRLEELVIDIRAKGGIPVLVTPVARNSWRGDSLAFSDLLSPYAEAVLGIGNRLKAPVIDLHQATVKWMQDLGLQKAKRYFYPGDYTHPNEYGGGQWARFVVEGIYASRNEALHKLKQMLLPPKQWPRTEILVKEDRLVCGFTAPPAPRTDYAKWNTDQRLTYAQALEMAAEGYGYFVSVDTQAKFPFFALAAAKENGYLPKGFPETEARLLRPAECGAFVPLMQLACRGRNQLNQEALTLWPKAEPDSTLLGHHAVQYALLLERMATGCTAHSAEKKDAPKGS